MDILTTIPSNFETSLDNNTYPSFTVTNRTVVKRSEWSSNLTWLTVVFVLLAIWMIVANSMIVAAPFVYRPLRKKTYFFVSSLGVADLLTAVTIPAAWFLSSLDNMSWEAYLQVRSNTYCQLIQFFNVFPLCCSIFNLLLIATDRYVGVVLPMKYDSILPSRVCRILIGIVWFTSILVAIPNFFWNRSFPDGQLRCFVIDMAQGYFYFLGGIYWILTLAMGVLYLRIYLTVKKELYVTRRRTNSINKNIFAKGSEKRTALMLFITFGVFVTFWTPLVISLHVFVTDTQPILAVQITHILAYLNSGMNFFIFVVRHNKYKIAFKKMCPFCWRPKTRIGLWTDTGIPGQPNGSTDVTSSDPRNTQTDIPMTPICQSPVVRLTFNLPNDDE